jgi:hypothetical protein
MTSVTTKKSFFSAGFAKHHVRILPEVASMYCRLPDEPINYEFPSLRPDLKRDKNFLPSG